MKYLLSIPIILAFIFVSPSALAATIGDVVEPLPSLPALTTSPVIITAAAINSNGPLFIQIYNNSDSIQDLRGWKLEFIAQNTSDKINIELVELSSWIQPRGYMVFSADEVINNSDGTFSLNADTYTQLLGLTTKYFQLRPSQDSGIAPPTFSISVNWPQWLERNKTTKYLETFTMKSGPAQLFGLGTYLPPEDTSGLQIMEILANARSCSPLEDALDCGDYVELFNSSEYPLVLDNYRLRTDSGGSKSSTSNTFKLSGELAPGAYVTIHFKDSGDTLSITNDGGYVWLEDTYGVQVYEPIIAYPDFTNNQGVSWAYNFATDSWQKMVPAPDQPNYFPPETEINTTIGIATASENSDMIDCGEGRERNPETNRCRTVVPLAANTSMPSACPAGQERNPDTNRCRSIVGAATVLASCAAGQERNPDTNRCRSILAASTTTTAPCPAGQERNPDTNRCRKISSVPSDASSTITDIESVEKLSTSNWLITAGAIIAAILYAVYEWRAEIFRRIRPLFKLN